jgi:hypothetical protein
MMRRIFAIITALTFGLCGIAHAQTTYTPQVLQWQYSFDSNGQAKAYYPGSVSYLSGPGGLPTNNPTFTGTLTGPVSTASTAFSIYSGAVPFARAYGNSANQFSDGYGTDTLIGLGAGNSLPFSDYLTTAIGWHALYSSTSVNTEATAVGWNSQNAETGQSYSTTLGVNTLGTCVTCGHDVAIGTDSMRNTTTASYDVGIGVTTLNNDFTPGYNIAIGDSTMQGNTNWNSGSGRNIAIGWSTFNCTSCTSAAKNIIIGAAIANNATSLNNSVVIGDIAMTNATSGGQNTIIGADAFTSLTGGNGVLTALGYGAGGSAANGQQDTLLGAYVGGSVFGTSGSNPTGIILIGSGAQTVDVPNTGTNNYINIENIIKVTGTGTPSSSVTTIAGLMTLNPYTVATLPTCNSGSKGEIALVSDASAPVYTNTLAGGGAVEALALCNGTNWTAH